MAVHLCRHMQAMPMDDALLGNLIGEVDAHPLSSLQMDGRPQVAIWNRRQAARIAAEDLAFQLPDLSGLAG